MDLESRAEELADRLLRHRSYTHGEYRLYVNEIALTLRGVVAEEREAILRTLRTVHKEHCVTHEEAKGVQLAIDCIRARKGE